MMQRITKIRSRKNRKAGQGNVDSAASAQVLIYRPGANRMPLPPIFQTELYVEADYKVPISTASITTGQVQLNAPNLPFRNFGTGSAFPSYTFLGPATESTLQPTGATALFGTTDGYNSYRVLKSSLSLRWQGSNSGNNVMCVVVPSLNTSSFSSVYAARTQPFARQASFSVSKSSTNCDKDGWFTSTISPYTVMGFDRAQAESDAFVNQGTWNSFPDLGLSWFVFFQTNDADVTSTSASTLQVRVKYTVQALFLDTLPPTLGLRRGECKEAPILVETSCTCKCVKPP